MIRPGFLTEDDGHDAAQLAVLQAKGGPVVIGWAVVPVAAPVWDDGEAQTEYFARVGWADGSTEEIWPDPRCRA